MASKSVCFKIGQDENKTTVATSYGNLSINYRISSADKEFLVTIFMENISALTFAQTPLVNLQSLGLFFIFENTVNLIYHLPTKNFKILS